MTIPLFIFVVDVESVGRRANELPAHNPLYDARQSGRLLVEALQT
jgi:hypothetical protein